MSVVLVIQYAKCMYRIVLSSVTSAAEAILFHIISQMAQFSEKKVTEHKMYVLFSLLFRLKYFSF